MRCLLKHVDAAGQLGGELVGHQFTGGIKSAAGATADVSRCRRPHGWNRALLQQPAGPWQRGLPRRSDGTPAQREEEADGSLRLLPSGQLMCQGIPQHVAPQSRRASSSRFLTPLRATLVVQASCAPRLDAELQGTPAASAACSRRLGLPAGAQFRRSALRSDFGATGAAAGQPAVAPHTPPRPVPPPALRLPSSWTTRL